MFPNTWEKGLKKGKERVIKLDKIRNTNIENILQKDPEVLKWWKNI